MALVSQSTLILTTSRTSMQQWRRELLDKTTLRPNQIVEYQSDEKQIGPMIAALNGFAPGADGEADAPTRRLTTSKPRC